MIQVHDIHCVLYFYYYYISSTSDHQTLDTGGWGPLTWSTEDYKPESKERNLGRCDGLKELTLEIRKYD